MKIEKDDKVSIINESGVCTFIREHNKRAIILDENGFEREIDYRLLVPYRSFHFTNPTIKQEDLTQKNTQEKKVSSLPEIDLHIDVLLLNSKHLTAHEKLLFQLAKFKEFTNTMLRDKQRKFLVIHGAGEGKLKNEIKLLLNSKKGFTMHDDHISNGKVGASIVEIFLSKAENL